MAETNFKVEFKQDDFVLDKVDTDRGVQKFKYNDSNIFKDSLKANGIKYDTYKEIKDFEKVYEQEAAKSLKTLSERVMKKDKLVNGVVASVPFSRRGYIESASNRKVERTIQLGDRKGETVTFSSFVLKKSDNNISKAEIRALKDELTKALLG